MSGLEKLAHDVGACPRCGAKPGTYCRTRSGRTTGLHAGRTQPVYLGWHAGYVEGLRDAVNDPAYAARQVGRKP